jgi:hypothetical protein
MAGFQMIEKKGFLNTNSFIEIQSVLEPERNSNLENIGYISTMKIGRDVVYFNKRLIKLLS